MNGSSHKINCIDLPNDFLNWNIHTIKKWYKNWELKYVICLCFLLTQHLSYRNKTLHYSIMTSFINYYLTTFLISTLHSQRVWLISSTVSIIKAELTKTQHVNMNQLLIDGKFQLYDFCITTHFYKTIMKFKFKLFSFS